MIALALVGCGAVHEDALHRDLGEARARLRPAEEEAPLDGSLDGYVARALARSPSLRAGYQRWRAETLRIGAARALPDPTVSYGFYALPVQTRVGPQRHRVMVRQSFPWPTRLTAAADAQSHAARAAQRAFEARALRLRAEVADAWWRLWALRAVRDAQREQVSLLEAAAESVRARIEVGQATLADAAQLELRRARLDDALAGLDEEERAAEAALRASIAAGPDEPLPTTREAADPALPPDASALEARLTAHPELLAFAARAEAHDARARAFEAERLPRFVVGVDWIETGEAASPVPGSGDDALIFDVGVSIPLWQGAYEDRQRAAEAEGVAERADAEAALLSARAALAEATSRIRDTHRRLRLYERTLIPQARGAYESVIGAQVTGRAPVAAVLLAQRELLEISVEAARARAAHGAAWARLEALVGAPRSELGRSR